MSKRSQRPFFKDREEKAMATKSASRKITDAETEVRDAKTARLRAQREAAEAAAPKQAEKKPKKGKKGKS